MGATSARRVGSMGAAWGLFGGCIWVGQGQHGDCVQLCRGCMRATWGCVGEAWGPAWGQRGGSVWTAVEWGQCVVDVKVVWELWTHASCVMQQCEGDVGATSGQHGSCLQAVGVSIL